MLNGLDLFSGIGGLTEALAEWVVPVAYCEIDRYCQGVLLSRMVDGTLPTARIWDKVGTLRGDQFRGKVDIVYAGFPCQDISTAGKGGGLEGKRSGLFFEIVRLMGELRPSFIFLENVPAITTRGGLRIAAEITALRYDQRWGMLSAQEVGANHKRERWFFLAHAERDGREQGPKMLRQGKPKPTGGGQDVADTSGRRGKRWMAGSGKTEARGAHTETKRRGWWSTESDVGRVAHGVPFRVDRLKGLGNAVVPAQAREAFKRLMGIGGDNGRSITGE